MAKLFDFAVSGTLSTIDRGSGPFRINMIATNEEAARQGAIDDLVAAGYENIEVTQVEKMRLVSVS